MMRMLYVAYGSNMNLNQMKFRCPNSKVIGNGRVIGWNLVFNIHADIIETNRKHDVVPVVVWDIHDKDWDYLDMYEGYPNYYIRRNIDVIMDNGEKTKAIVYVMNSKRKGIAPPHEDYFNTILNGYKANGINTETLYNALTHSILNETEYNQYNIKKG